MNTAGINVPPAHPWSARHAIRLGKSVLAAQPSEAPTKSATASVNRPRSDSACVSSPVSGMVIASAIR